MGQMNLDRRLADTEGIGDLLVGSARGHLPQHGNLARSQLHLSHPRHQFRCNDLGDPGSALMYGAYASNQICGGDVLEEIPLRAGLEGPTDIVIRVVGREHDEHGVRKLLPQGLHYVDTIESRHAKIQQRNIRALLSIKQDGGIAVRRLRDHSDIRLLTKDLGDAIADDCVVVGEKYTNRYGLHTHFSMSAAGQDLDPCNCAQTTAERLSRQSLRLADPGYAFRTICTPFHAQPSAELFRHFDADTLVTVHSIPPPWGLEFTMRTLAAEEPLAEPSVGPGNDSRLPGDEARPGPAPAPGREPHMSVQFSRVVNARSLERRRGLSRLNVDLLAFRELASPLVTFDEFQISTAVCTPHPHAGCSSVSYLFEDSCGSLRSRDSLGNDMTTRPGGLVWTQAGAGVVHEEIPAILGREVHGLQLCVNLSSSAKLSRPTVFHIEPEDVPLWRNDGGDRVRVVVGTFSGISSPLAPAEPLSLLDVRMRSAVQFELPAGHNAIVYLLSGIAQTVAIGHARRLESRQAVAFQGIGNSALIQLIGCAHLVVVMGPEIHEPVIADGQFVMNFPWQIDAAIARYRAGEMGQIDTAAPPAGP